MRRRLFSKFGMTLGIGVTSLALSGWSTGSEPSEAERVQLGSGELTEGIPGDGPLTLDQVSAWLEDPKNHRQLDVELPEGLSDGRDAIYIPEDNPLTRAKIELGRQLYFDRRLSKHAEVSCADCHHPDEGYARETRFGIGVGGQEGNRNSPTSYNRLLSQAQFWDGRAESLEEQAVGPIANPIEMANSHEVAVKFVSDNAVYRAQFDKIFDRDPNIDDIGRAIAAFERVIVTGDSPYDYQRRLERMERLLEFEGLTDMALLKEEEPEWYEEYTALKREAAEHPMSESAMRGQTLFFSQEVNCSACHVGANFTDELYHNLGVGMDADQPDLGRYEVTGEEKDKGAFKTPTLRNVALTPPYMHDGSQETLYEVVEWYVKGGHPNPYLSDKVHKFEASEQDKQDLVAFMEALTGPFPEVEQERLPVD
jgi:cytochrome c peroxidase